MEPLEQRAMGLELSATEFYDRFQLVETHTDAYDREYELCLDKLNKNQIAVRQYYIQEMVLEDVLANLNNYFALQSLDGICKLLCFSYGRTRTKINAAFDYCHLTLEKFLTSHKILTYDFFLGMFLDLVYTSYQLQQLGYVLDDFRRDNILIEWGPDKSLKFKIYLDERQKNFGSLIGGETGSLRSQMYLSPERLRIIKSEGIQEHNNERMCIYEIGLLILDISTLQIQDSFHSIVGLGSKGQSYIQINQDVVNAKLDALKSKFQDRSLWELVSKMLQKQNQRPCFFQLHEQGIRLITPLMSGSFKLSRISKSGHISSINRKNIQRSIGQSQSKINSQLLRIKSPHDTNLCQSSDENTNQNILQNSCYYTQMNGTKPSIQRLRSIFSKVRAHQQVFADFQNFINILAGKNTSQIRMYKDGSLYFGQLVNKIRQGSGILLYSNRDLFYGTWINDRKISGTCIYQNGQSYTGTLNNGKSGQGVYRYYNGSVYQGQWLNDCRHGKGVLISQNGERYEGGWNFDKKDGLARFINRKGVIYDGFYVKGHKSGECSLTFPDGKKISGVWQKISKGQGMLFFKNDNTHQQVIKNQQRSTLKALQNHNGIYQGYFSNSAPNGMCYISYQNEQKYKGCLSNGLKEGKGTYTYLNGDVFEGEWRNNNKYLGVYIFKNGDVFRGQFKQNEAIKGRMDYSCGDYYEGCFKNGLRQGNGRYTRSDGEVIEGIWLQDQCVSASAIKN